MEALGQRTAPTARGSAFMSLPTPNIFAGEQNFHSRLERVSAQDMEKVVETIVHLGQIWEEKA